jgi:protein-tyrosine phosphatase
VIGLAREHRSYAVQLEPSVVRRSFTLREFVRILPMAGPYFGPTIGARLRAAAGAAALARSRVPVSGPGADDITDPYGAPVQVYRRVFAEIHDAVAQIVTAVS